MLAVAVLVPGLLFAAAAWQNHADVVREGGNAIRRTAAVMQEHARKVFETAELAIGQVSERIDDMEPAQLDDPATGELLGRLRASMDQVVSIAVMDENGIVVAASEPGVRGRDRSDSRVFQDGRAGGDRTFVGPLERGAGGMAGFPIARRRVGPDGQFAGVITVVASSAYFARFYATIAPPMRHVGLLLRADGTILAQDPADAAATPAIAGLLARRLAREAASDRLFRDTPDDGMARDAALRQVGGYPVFVAFVVPHRVVLARWYDNLVVFASVAALAASTLLLVSWLALRGAQAEQLALARLRGEIAQRQAAEEQLRHAQRMDAVGQLTGGVAHDFNNLLTAILGNLELIQRAGPRPDGMARVERLAATAIKAVERGSALTKSLLAFSRKQPLQPVALDANALVAELRDLLRQAAGVGVEVAFAPAAGLPACLADPAELQGALLNLVINARDAMPEGGRLRITTEVVGLGEAALADNPEARPGRFVALAVADTGHGMPAEVAAKAFEPFFTTKPIGQGTGLGLSQVFGFVRQLGGHVVIGAAAEGGTVVTLYLPVAG